MALFSTYSPVSGELPLGEHLSLDGAFEPAISGHQHVLAYREGGGIPERHGGPIGSLQRLNQAESAFLVVGDDVAGSGERLPVDQPHTVRLRNQVADGEHEPVVANDDAVAGTFRAEHRRGQGVFRDAGAKRYHSPQNMLDIEGECFGIELHRSVSRGASTGPEAPEIR